jgi:hypothetical protein
MDQHSLEQDGPGGHDAQLELEAHGLVFLYYDRRDTIRVTRKADGRTVDTIQDAGRPTTLDKLASVCNNWIAVRLGATSPANAHCASCGQELEPVFAEDTARQYKDALWVRFEGGFGMHIDPIDQGIAFDSDVALEAVICGTCATALEAQHPWINALLS